MNLTLPDAYKESAIQSLKDSGADGYYEYEVRILNDIFGGCTNKEELLNTLNEMALAGWRLKSTHTNELGKDSVLGVNATADETVLIFERFVKF